MQYWNYMHTSEIVSNDKDISLHVAYIGFLTEIPHLMLSDDLTIMVIW